MAKIIKDDTKITIILVDKDIELTIKYPKHSHLKNRLKLLELLKENLFKI